MMSAIGIIFPTNVNPLEHEVNSPSYITHAPIYINGNADFTAENGVTGGTGTQSDPYIIEGWDINASSDNGIEIWYTDVYFIIRNCYVHDGRANRNSGIIFFNVQNERIENTTLTNNHRGIYLVESSSNTIHNTNVLNNLYGIFMDESTNITISNNSASNNSIAIILLNSNTNTIFNNIIISNEFEGIRLVSSSNNNISNNNVSNNKYGIDLDSSSNNSIFSNNISSNECSIYIESGFYESSNYNTFIFNNISYNGCCVAIHGAYCGDNIFHHNNFIKSSAVNVIGYGVNTRWDDSHGEGNYWSDYMGLDNGSNGRIAGDGVGDTNIPHLGLDNYPLIEPVGQRNMPPIISLVNVSSIKINSATITWRTDENSDTRVNYSVNANLFFNSSICNSTMMTSHSATLSGLSPNTTYYFEVSSTDRFGNSATDNNNSKYYRFTTPEVTPPVISSVLVSIIAHNSVKITWITDENSDSKVIYSSNEDLSSNFTHYKSVLITNHSIILTDLRLRTTYYFEVSSTDTHGSTEIDDNNAHYYTFTTKLSFDYWWIILLVVIIVIIVVIVVMSKRNK
jgi:parallel beta-helix repeat protein